MFNFQHSTSMKIEVFEKQKNLLSSKDKINKILSENSPNIFAYDIYNDETLIGFAMFEKNYTDDNTKLQSLLLWNFAIDKNFQNSHYGTQALRELLIMVSKKEKCSNFIVTYKKENKVAKHVYEKLGFTDFNSSDAQDEESLLLNL